VDDVSLDIDKGQLHALIGPNGAGKTTLIHLLAGAARPDTGRIRLDGRDVAALPVHRRVALGLARSYQIASLFPNFNAVENLALAVQARHGRHFGCWRAIADDDAIEREASAVLGEIGLADRANARVDTLAHGEKRQLEVGLALAAGATTLLLDEPMAGMGAGESARMVTLLTRLKGRHTILLVEHDMDTVFQLADRISVLVNGRLVATGTPAAIRANAEVRHAYLGEGAA
jgi:branched-chain amino acid transport system ATP-binding protein